MMKMIDKIIEKASKVATKEVFNILDKRKKEKQKEPSILEQLMKNPEEFKLEAWVNGNEIIFKLIKNENKEDPK